MNHPPAPPQQHCISFTRRTLAILSGLAVLLAAAVGLAPAALATPLPPEPSFAPVPPPLPPAAVPAHFALWTIAVFLVATVILSAATTLITLALDRSRQARAEATAASEPQPSERIPFTSPARYNGDLEIINSHPRDPA